MLVKKYLFVSGAEGLKILLLLDVQVRSDGSSRAAVAELSIKTRHLIPSPCCVVETVEF